MFYSFDLTIPANTLEAAAVTLRARMVPGTLHHVAVQFPPGCRGLVQTRAFHAAHQLFPSNQDAVLASDAFTVEWTEEWELAQRPFFLTLEGFSPGTSFAHVITWRFAVRERTLAPTPAPAPALAPPILGELLIPDELLAVT